MANPIAKYYFNGENTIKNYDYVCLFVNYGSRFYSTSNIVGSIASLMATTLSACDIESQNLVKNNIMYPYTRIPKINDFYYTYLESL